MAYTQCPLCGKKGINIPQTSQENSHTCRYCKKIIDSSMKGSTQLFWNTENKEYFSFLNFHFDVTTAKNLLTKKFHPLDKLLLDDSLRSLIRRPKPGKISCSLVQIEWEKIDQDSNNYDLSFPVIIATLKKGNYLPIDGWHRIAKACEQGTEELPAFILTEKETKQISL